CDANVPENILATTGEVSRLAVPRSVSQLYRATGDSRYRASEVSLRLFQLIYALAKRDGLTHLIAAMEPSLVRICAMFDFPWTPVGPGVDYGGVVRPYLLSLTAFDAIKTKIAHNFRLASET